MISILKFKREKKDLKIDPALHIGLWSVDPLDGGILEIIYPSTKVKAYDALDKISLKIKNLINITVRDMTFKTEWSLSPLTIENYHYYLYGFFLDKWRVVSIHLPIDFSLWLIDNKSDLLLFESQLSKVTFLPTQKWEEEIIAPMYDEFLDQKEQFLISKKS